MILLSQLQEYAKGLGSAILFLVAMYGWIWIKKVFDQKKRNAINEIDLTNKKINLENQSKPIDQLVSESNKSHGANEVVEPPGDNPKKRD